MTPPPPVDVEPAEAMLAELAGLDLSLARHVHACATSTEDPAEVADLARAYQRIARSVRQSLALHARLRRERERELRDNPPPPAPPPPKPARDPARIAERRAAVREAALRVVWAEYEDGDWRDAGYMCDLVEERLRFAAGENTFGLVARDGAWDVEALDDHIVRFCDGLDLPEAAARAWRDLPDPPPEVLEQPDDDEDEDADASAPSWRSSA